MAKVKAFLLSQWTDIKGNVKFWLLSTIVVGGGGAVLVPWLLRTIQRFRGAPQQDRIGYEILGALVFLGVSVCCLLLYFVSRDGRRKQVAITPPSAPPPATKPTPTPAELELNAQLLKPPPTPPPVDLQGEVRELYILRTDDLLLSRVFVVVRVQIVNRGPDAATITNCSLRISLNNFSANGELAEIQQNWQLKKQRTGIIGMAYDEFPIEPALGINNHNEVYRKGIPREGWLAFQVYVSNGVEFPNAQFEIYLTDSLGGRHVFRRPVGVYPKTGEVVAHYSTIPITTSLKAPS